MLVLSFRDMSTPQASAVTSAAVYELDVDGPAFSWNPPPKLTLVDWDQVKAAWRGKHVCFVVHGFNVGRDNGYTSFGCASQEMAPDGALPGMGAPGPWDLTASGIDVAVPVLWAGDWYLPINYPFLLPDVRLTGAHFADLILSAATQMSRVSFVSHSMGARVVLETVQQTLAKAAKKGYRTPRFDTALLTAAAASDEVLDDPNYALAVAAIERFVVVSSRADRVLSLAFPPGNAVEQALWPNDPGADAALGRYGPRLKTGSAALGKTEWYEIPQGTGDPRFNQGHEDYFPWPWQDPPDPVFPNGWSRKRVDIGLISQAVLDNGTPAWPPAKPVTPRASDD
ncbi:alpha/beta hydrolase [Phenylobacterium montanum]|uniref:Alpha/beta hydrolase n=1 Tax=Phenylobacterium montanum TaxID=2823693 RepID=A0A975IUM3_9CAUL|nr:alpha/beta hydrolase [Caulobacter sp. S6]QUD87948.1 alpha/beta hydrolase [Caulobacter sp. S6]